MIGGSDVCLDVAISPEFTMEAAIAAFLDAWDDSILIKESQYECFIYRDARSKRIWDLKGSTKYNWNNMVHLLVDDKDLTVVFDELTEETDYLVSRILYWMRHLTRFNNESQR